MKSFTLLAVAVLALAVAFAVFNLKHEDSVTVTVVPTKAWPSFTCQEDEIMAWLDRGTRQAECVNIEEFEAAL